MADDIVVAGGAYSDTLRAPERNGKKFQAVTVESLLPVPVAKEPFSRVAKVISTATTTPLVAAVEGQTVAIHGLIIRNPPGGTKTTVTLQDTTGVNVIGTNVTLVFEPGESLTLALRANRYFDAVAAGRGLDIVTDAVGPLFVYLEHAQQA